MLIKASPDAQNEIKRIVNTLDTEQGTDRQVKIFQLRHIVPGPSLENMLATITEGDVRFAMDEAHKVVVATGAEPSLAVVEAFLNRMDTETAGAFAAKPAAKEVQLRLVWLVGGLADDAAAVPPPNLETVAQELAKIGVTNLTMAAQIVVNITEGEKFSASGSAKVNEPCTVKLAGMFGDMGPEGLSPADQPSWRLEITATAPAGERRTPAVSPADDHQGPAWPDRRAGSHTGRIQARGICGAGAAQNSGAGRSEDGLTSGQRTLDCGA